MCTCVYIYKKKYSILTLVGQQGSLKIILMVMKLVFSMQNCLGFLLFSYIQEELFFISCLDIICVSMCFLCGSVVMAEAEESWMPFCAFFQCCIELVSKGPLFKAGHV